MTDKQPKTFIIVNKMTKERWTAKSNKTSWSTVGAAKNAWANTYAFDGDMLEKAGITPIYRHFSGSYKQLENHFFGDQTLWEIVELALYSDFDTKSRALYETANSFLIEHDIKRVDQIFAIPVEALRGLLVAQLSIIQKKDTHE